MWDGTIIVPVNNSLTISGGQHSFQPNAVVDFSGFFYAEGRRGEREVEGRRREGEGGRECVYI
jgi:hypothetical protein